MEALLVELRAKRRFSLGPQPADGELTKLVGESLAGPADVPIDLGFHLMLREGSVSGEIIDRLLARPAITVDPGVDHQPRGAPHFIAELTESLIGCPIDAEFIAEPFAIEAPSLAHS